MNWRRECWLRGEKEKGRGDKHTGLTNKRANNTGKVATVFILCSIALLLWHAKKNMYVLLKCNCSIDVSLLCALNHFKLLLAKLQLRNDEYFVIYSSI